MGLLTLLLRGLAGAFPELTERFYSRGLFVIIRYAWDFSIGLLPLPLLYLLLLLLGIVLVKKARSWYRSQQRLKGFVLAVLAFLGILITSFFFLWGFNYARVPLEEQLGIEPATSSADSLDAWLSQATTELIRSRKQLAYDMSDSLPEDIIPPGAIAQLRASLKQHLQAWSIPAPGRVKAKAIGPQGWLIGLGAAGIYLPWTGQGQYDAALHHLEVPVVSAHEMGHALGFTDEGVCNFLGYIACVGAKDSTLQYAGRLGIWRALARSAYVSKTALYHQYYGSLPEGIRQDLAGIRRRQQRYKGWFPGFSRMVYDSYLKQQGVEGGMASYGRGVLLWHAYHEL